MKVRTVFQVTGVILLLTHAGPSIAAPSEATLPAGSPLNPGLTPSSQRIVQSSPARLSYPKTLLAMPVSDPLRLDLDGDPILALATPAGHSDFGNAVAAAVQRNPALDESEAQVAEAIGARNEASARRLATLDLSLSHYEIVSRAFTHASPNIIERSRPLRRTDANANLQQTMYDFGANRDRFEAAEERLASARHASADSETQIALKTVGAWYNVFGYRALVSLATAFISSQRDLRSELEHRVAQGYSAPADIIQLDSYIASTSSEIADYRRRLQTAEAQFTELVGVPPPTDLQRAPPPAIQYRSAEEAEADTRRMPAVLAAGALAQAAHSEAKAYHADQLPKLSVGADIGRYGALENPRDYDARVTGTLSWRLFGGAKQRTEQAVARERGAAARYERVSEEARRDAAIAFTDLQGLQASEQAVRQGYISARRSRDVTAQRFAVSRGTLFDLVAAENTYYSAAARYILTLTDLDTARYALLARTGTLIDALGLPQRPAP